VLTPPAHPRRSLWRVLAIAAAVLAVLAVCAWWLPSLFTPSLTFDGPLEFTLADRNDPATPKSLGTPGTLPLTLADRFHLRAGRADAPPAHFYLLYIDSEGKVTALHPRGWSAADLPTADVKRPDFRWPEVREANLTGSAEGLESIILLIRGRPLTARENVALWGLLDGQSQRWHQPKQWKHKDRAVYWEDAERRRHMGAPLPNAEGPGDDPLTQTEQFLLSVKSRKLAPYSLAYCYWFSGR
jgi:hypothetical protein